MYLAVRNCAHLSARWAQKLAQMRSVLALDTRMNPTDRRNLSYHNYTFPPMLRAAFCSAREVVDYGRRYQERVHKSCSRG
jgi:hypothetical protein